MTRRQIGTLIAGTITASAGCGSVVSGDEPLRYKASEVRPSDTALAESGYEHQATQTSTITKEFDVGGISREAEAVNVVSEYDKAIDMGALGSQRSAIFVAAATPKIETIGRTFNPIKDMTNQEVAEDFQSQYNDVTIREEIGTDTINVFEKDVEFSMFSAESRLNGHTIDVYLHLGVAEINTDFVVLLGSYPQGATDEQTNVFNLAESVEQIE